MRRLLAIISILVLLCGISVSVSAAPSAKGVSAYATVTNDGSAQVTLTVNLHLDSVVSGLRFPLPGNSDNVTVNGARAHSRMEKGLRQVDISGVVGKAVGDFTLTFVYALDDLIVTNDAGQLELQLPLLAGFAYPVQALELSVTLPGPVTGKPAFSSGYHQANIEKDIYCTTTGATITAVSQTELKDHETLVMTLLVTEEMFPQTRIAPPDFQTVETFSTVFLLIALAYWVLFLRNLPSWPARRATPPEGYTAGELGSLLHLRGGNLTMMVFSWAQLGYLLIHLKPNGRVMLYRQMDMGNERSAFEQRCFKQLFGGRDSVDTATNRYGDLFLSVEKMKPNVSALVHPRSGNLMVFRALAAVAGMFGGVAIAIGLSTGAALQWLLIILFGALALYSSWVIQIWAGNLLAPDRRPLWIALGICGVWLLLSVLAGLFSVGMRMAAVQLLMGLLAALGGRRTPAGRQLVGETLGLRRYLRSISPEELRSIGQNNPEYFHRMFPYAMALGVDKAFAKRFGRLPIGACPYVATGFDNDMYAGQWRALLRRIFRSMNVQMENRWKDKLAEWIRMFIK